MKGIQSIWTATLMMMAVISYGQNETDALRYSQFDMTGTARNVGLGGAMTALGADLSAMTVNPAGVGVFNRSEMGITTQLGIGFTNGTFLGQESSASKSNFNVGNAGFVIRIKNRRGNEESVNGWKSFSLGLNYTRLQNFHRNTSLSGENNSSSLIDEYVAAANGYSPDQLPDASPFGANLAWQTWLIDQYGPLSDYHRNVLPNYGQEQRITETTSGAISQADLLFGGNYSNTLYIGGSIGYQNVNYRKEQDHSEVAPFDSTNGFNNFSRIDYLRTTGSGVNLKFGLIYRPVDWFRVGASIHSPTFFSMKENFSSTIISNFDTASFSYSSPEGYFDYRLTTPFRANGGIAFVIAKMAVVSVDYEYVNYSSARFRSSNTFLTAENANVRSRLHWAGNIKAGAEVKLGKFSLRGGFGMNADPYSGMLSLRDSRYSLGVGWKFRHFYVDVTYLLQNQEQDYVVYNLDLVPPAEVQTRTHSLMGSVGVRF